MNLLNPASHQDPDVLEGYLLDQVAKFNFNEDVRMILDLFLDNYSQITIHPLYQIGEHILTWS